MSEYKQLVADIIKNVGGPENITDLKHCVTRLRFTLVDESKANDKVIKNMDGVVTVMKGMGQYMVVIGEHVHDVYVEVLRQLGRSDETPVEAPKNNTSVFNKVIGYISGCLGPCLGIMCASGIIKGVLALAGMAGLPADSGIYMLMNAAGDAFFYFLPIFLGFNSAKMLNIDPFFGVLLAGAMSYPAVQGVPVNLFGLEVTATYQGQFFPILVGVAIAAPMYKFFKKSLPKMIENFLTPALTLLITLPIVFVVVGPLVGYIAGLIPLVMNWILNISPVLTCAFIGAFWQVFVLLGVHGPVVMVEFSNLLQGVPSLMLAVTSMVCFSQVGVVLAIFLKTKNAKLKSVSFPAFISGIFGVTEPAIYGVTLPRIKMFVVSCIGGAVTGAVIGFLNLKRFYQTGMGVFGLLGLLHPENPQVAPIALVTAVSFLVPFVIAYVMYKDQGEDLVEEKPAEVKKANKEVVCSVANGKVKPLAESSDEAFASGELGKGILVVPEEGKIFAPINGVVRALFPTKHAIAIVSDEGAEVLIHIGINTVSLEGKYFEAHIVQGDVVKKGQLLVSFDKAAVEKEGFSTETPVIVINSDNYADVVETASGNVKAGDELLTLLA